MVTNKGKFIYSGRIPTDLKHLYPSSKEAFFRTRFRVQREKPELVAEPAALEAAFERLVIDARNGVPKAVGDSGIERYKQIAWSNIDDPRTEREKLEDMRGEAEALVRGLVGVDHLGDNGDEARRQIVAEEIERNSGHPLLYRSVT